MTRAAEQALGARVFHGNAEPGWFMRIPLVDTSTAPFRGRQDISGRYAADVTLAAYRLKLGAVVPVTTGARAGVGSRDLAIVERAIGDTSVTVRVRLTKPALAWQRARELDFLLLNRARGEAMPGHSTTRLGRFRQLSPLYLWSPVETIGFSKVLLNRQRLTDEWFQDAALAVLTIEEEGTFTVRVTADKFPRL